MKFLYHAWDGAFQIGDNLIIPTYCKMFPNSIPVFCVKDEYLEEFSKVKFIVDGQVIQTEIFPSSKVYEYREFVKNGTNVSHLPLQFNKYRNTYDIDVPDVEVPDKFTILHYNSYLDLNWVPNTGRYIFNHVWDAILSDSILMNTLKPIYNISPERRIINNEFVSTKKTTLLELFSMVKKCTSFIGTGSGPSVLAHILGKKMVVSWIDYTLLDSGLANACRHIRDFFYPFDNISYFHPQSQTLRDVVGAIKTRYITKLI